MNRFVALSSLLPLLGCGSAPPPELPDRVEVNLPFDELDHDQQMAFMATRVTPQMRESFQGYDAERYANFGCATCHGEGAEERDFVMPSPDLLPLHPSGTPEQRAMVEEHPEMVRYMFNHVIPEMRELLGEAEYDAETGEGFSCYACHPHAGEGESVTAADTFPARM